MSDAGGTGDPTETLEMNWYLITTKKHATPRSGSRRQRNGILTAEDKEVGQGPECHEQPCWRPMLQCPKWSDQGFD